MDTTAPPSPQHEAHLVEGSGKANSNGRATLHPSFGEAFWFWFKLGWISFGGPAGQIAIMQTELVEKKKWIGQARFLHALNYCMLLPGPEAQQLAIYIGWLLHKTAGGIVAGTLFVLPSFFILWGLSFIYAAYGTTPWIASLFYGLKPAVMSIVGAAVLRIGRKALKNEVMWGIAALSFLALFLLKLPFPLIIFAAGVIGLLGGIFWKHPFMPVVVGHGGSTQEASVLGDDDLSPPHTRPSLARALRITVLWMILWWAPTLTLGFSIGWESTLFKEGLFFSKAAVVTFGGAYAVLPYVAQQAVEHYGWLRADQMVDGLGLAETTPGPLIMVLPFVGFMGGWNQSGGLTPWAAATIGALLTTWVTFTPCFLWIFLGGPHIEQLRGNRHLTAALSTITAAIVGVILNLALWFGWHVLFPFGGWQLDGFAACVSLLAFVGLVKGKWDVIPIVLASSIAGLLYKFILAY